MDVLVSEDIQYISIHPCHLKSSSPMCLDACSSHIVLVYSVVKMNTKLTGNLKLPFLLGGSSLPVRRTHAQPTILLRRGRSCEDVVV